MTSQDSARNTIHVVALAAADLKSVLATGTESLANVIAVHTSGTHDAEVTYWPPPPLERLAESFAERSTDLDDIDVAILSVGLATPLDSRSDDVDGWFSEPFAEAISLLKSHSVFTIVLNGSTFDPTESSSSWAGAAPPLSLMVHRLDAALIELSVLDGIAIVDIDRLVAETGGAGIVRGLLEYRPECSATVTAEIVRILDDSRFFAPGPSVTQVGRRRDASAV